MRHEDWDIADKWKAKTEVNMNNVRSIRIGLIPKIINKGEMVKWELGYRVDKVDRVEKGRETPT